MANIEILVNHNPYETRVAILEDGVLQDVFVERARTRGITGNIYKGRVQRVLRGMDAAFIDIGLERAGFLHIKNMKNLRTDSNKSVEDILYEGEPLLVQILKDPIGTKGARLTTDISIASRFLVYLPTASEIGVSFKITSEQQRQQYREIMHNILTTTDRKGGFIIRTATENNDMWALNADCQYLYRLWDSILDSSRRAKVGTLIYSELPLYLKVMRDFVAPNVSRIIVDDPTAHQHMQRFAENFLLEMREHLFLHQEGNNLFSRYGIENELEASLTKRVNLASGGSVVIDQTEAMTTIDVNTGTFIGSQSQEETIYKTNLEAAKTIAQQLRIRNLGGIIMIDFIDMEQQEHRDNVMKALEEALAGDRVKYTISPMSPLGIIEMTRKRTRKSMREVMCTVCPTCEGHGYIKSNETVAYQIFRDLMREFREYHPRALTITAGADLIEYIKEEETAFFADLQALMNIPIYFKENEKYFAGRYHINHG